VTGPPVAQAASDAAPAAWLQRARELVRRTVAGAWRDNIFSESAAAAFWQTLALPPLLLGLFGILSYVGDWFGSGTVAALEQWIVSMTAGVFSRNAVEQLIAPTVHEILTTARGELVSVGFVLSLWSGSSAMSSFLDAITRAHDQYEIRHPVWQRTLALLLYLAGLTIGIIALPSIAVGPDRLVRWLPASWGHTAAVVITSLYGPVIAVVLILALTTLYVVALPRRPRWRRGLPGAVLAAVVFLAGATGLRIYLNWLTGSGYTYGALAAPIAFLLATFFIALAIVLGAHFNAAAAHLWPALPTDRSGTPPGETPAASSEAPVPRRRAPRGSDNVR
jgi:membrane protein